MNDGAYLMDKIRSRCIDDADCKIWQGSANNRGPILGFEGRELSVRRMVWELHHAQPFPAGLLAARCDENKLCVNPEHIKAVTRGDVVRKVMRAKPAEKKYAERAKGHRTRGLSLSDEAAREIRTSGEHWSVLKERHSVSKSAIYAIRQGRYRRDMSNPFAGLRSLRSRA